MPSSKSPRIRAGIVGWAVGLHLAFVVLVVSHAVELFAESPAGGPLIAGMTYYDALTFANRNFGFFAPEVSADCTVDLVLFRDSGLPEVQRLGFENREMEVKLYAMIGTFGSSPDAMDLLARSWALRAMNHDASLVRVDVVVRQNVIPSMGAYRRGERLSQEPFYRTTFELPRARADARPH